MGLRLHKVLHPLRARTSIDAAARAQLADFVSTMEHTVASAKKDVELVDLELVEVMQGRALSHRMFLTSTGDGAVYGPRGTEVVADVVQHFAQARGGQDAIVVELAAALARDAKALGVKARFDADVGGSAGPADEG